VSKRLTDAAIREAMARAERTDVYNVRAGYDLLLVAAEALARGEEIAALRAEVAVFRNAGHAETCGGMDEAEGRCGCGYLQREGAHAALLAAWAEAIPPDAEERVAKALADLSEAPMVTGWQRECARAVLAALRGAS